MFQPPDIKYKIDLKSMMRVISARAKANGAEYNATYRQSSTEIECAGVTVRLNLLMVYNKLNTVVDERMTTITIGDRRYWYNVHGTYAKLRDVAHHNGSVSTQDVFNAICSEAQNGCPIPVVPIPKFLLGAKLVSSVDGKHVVDTYAKEGLPILFFYTENLECEACLFHLHGFDACLPTHNPAIRLPKFTMPIPIDGLLEVIPQFHAMCAQLPIELVTRKAIGNLFNTAYQILYVMREPGRIITWLDDTHIKNVNFNLGTHFTISMESQGSVFNQANEVIRIQNGVRFRKLPTRYYEIDYGAKIAEKFFVETFPAT